MVSGAWSRMCDVQSTGSQNTRRTEHANEQQKRCGMIKPTTQRALFRESDDSRWLGDVCRALDELKRSIGTLNEKSDEARSALACDIGKAKNEIIRAVNRRQRSVDSTKVPDDRDVREQILLYVRLLAANPRMETGTACAKVLRRHPSGYARKTSLISFVARHAEFIEDCIDVFKATGRVPVLEA